MDQSTSTTANGMAAGEKADKTMPLVVYILYALGFFTGITAIAGLVVAYMKRGSEGEMHDSHYTYQIRTFWFGLATLVVGALLAIVLIGYLVMLWWVVWTLVRVVKGMIRLNEGRPIENPTTLLW